MKALTATDREAMELAFAAKLAANRYRLDVVVGGLWEWNQGSLAGISAPDKWQLELFREIGEALKSRGFDGVESAKLVRVALSSGRGIGKGAFLGMLVVALMACWPNCRITLMANTDDQLQRRTYAEVLKWLKSSVVAHWFESNASLIWKVGFKETWFCAPMTWNLENPQGSAGQHNVGSLNVFLLDEASGIPDEISDVIVAGLTSGLPLFCCFGNMTETKGFFYRAIFGEDKRYFDVSKAIDSRECRFPNKDKIAEDLEKHGEDSDWFRVWVRGLAPKSAEGQYFPDDTVQECLKVRPSRLKTDALVVGGDLSWGGRDESCFWFRCGLDAWSIPPLLISGEQSRNPDFMVSKIADILEREWNGRKVEAMFLDSAGSCGRIAPHLWDMGFRNVREVNFGGHSMDQTRWANARSMMFYRLKQAMGTAEMPGLGIYSDPRLVEDMKELRVRFHMPLLFEPKGDIRKPKRLGRSTDRLDALALTYFAPVKTAAAREAVEASRARRFPASTGRWTEWS